jgi:hypothetical protein
MVTTPLIPELFDAHGAGPFATADWERIGAIIGAEAEGARSRLWHATVLQWAELACGVFNKFVDADSAKLLSYRVGQSARLIVVAPTRGGTEMRWPGFGEWVLNRVLPFLAPIAVVPPWPISAVFVHNVPTFDMYVRALDDGNSLMPGGVYIAGGRTPPHVAILGTMHLLGLRVVYIHELVHALVNHLVMPTWLEEGICRHLEHEVLPDHRVYFSTERDAKRNDFWKEHGLGTFWKGTCFGHAGAHEAYVLAMGVVRRLLEGGEERFFRFVRLAKKEDAGFAACEEVFGGSLEGVAVKLLGRVA